MDPAREAPGLAASIAQAYHDQGHAMIPGLDAAALADLLAAADRALAERGHRRGNGAAYAARDLLSDAVVSAWAVAQLPWIAPLLTGTENASEPEVISALLLDKHSTADWRLPMHQDLAVPVAARPSAPFPGWGPWSRKDGVDHVQPPPQLSQRRLALRVHLDACGPGSGELTVVPGSHRRLLDDADLDDLVRKGPIIPVHAAAGDVLVMHPWLLHASEPRAADAPGRRRILHLEYAGLPLPPGLAWHRPALTHAPGAMPATVAKP
jgi:hypothetical protein